jgi:hypothetical protein
MVALYFLVSLFSHFSPQNAFLPIHNGPSKVIVEFADLKGISVGSAVLLDGHLVGKVNSVIDSNIGDLQTAAELSPSTFSVSLSIAPSYRSLIRRGTVALIKSPLTFKSDSPRPVVELLIPKESSQAVLDDGEKIFGFSSFEEFWTADLSKLGLPQGSFESTLG